MTPPPAGHDRPGDPCIIVIFGASGDLTKRKLLPALYNLKALGLLPKDFAILGVAVSPGDDQWFRDEITSEIHEFSAHRPIDETIWEEFRKRSFYISGDLNSTATFEKLKTVLERVHGQLKIPGNILFYLAVAPTLFSTVVRQLGAIGLTKEDEKGWRRVIVEKPFGHDLSSARALNNELSQELKENQIYRIDHYLGKETVQNILVFRFGNSVFEPTWNRRYIEYVQVTVAETLGVELRGSYYDQAGAMRDMVQNHILSVLALIAMEPPSSISGDSVRDEKLKVLEAIRPMSPEEILSNTIRGQYGAGEISGEAVPAYRREPQVSLSSNTETFVALKLSVENWRWAQVPFFIRTGKRLAAHTTQVVIGFRTVPLLLFGKNMPNHIPPNRLVLYIQPEEGITLDIHAKRPGPKITLANVPLNFNYSEFGRGDGATGYETLLYDCIIGDPTLFHRYDSVDTSWQIVDPILDVWQALPARDFPNYAAGSWGPESSDRLIAKFGHQWHHYPKIS
ncbi:MAG: glucose-6-phosphate dehydrogenase [Verrucomicrobia bacterium]|nr:MAG: glucose-6-phosphate dehydrogenase [Verrucomicrobiota bacterium]